MILSEEAKHSKRALELLALAFGDEEAQLIETIFTAESDEDILLRVREVKALRSIKIQLRSILDTEQLD